ncbi:putative ankyrin repeats (many copies) [Lyophyllum shimeji]|uniref:Ankyrin repeats (Many copies) n=1 Tax=Lyophyllum shimeji TaxID=47721 RepID=A0A9P3PQK1_LYOSH|nr:putative ankyrin repeats (many copies) [Lyophyllum shimeji]
MEKNIWVAAGDGDLARVKELVEQQSLDPNIPDPFTYTPMHAAASYGQLAVLEYLISRGGNVNVTDEDGDTPLYTVENVETARFLVDQGAIVHRRNKEGVSPIEHLSEDFPHIASFLQDLHPHPAPSTNGHLNGGPPQSPSQHQQNAASEQLTDALMASVEDIMHRAAAEGREPDDELREAVGRAVLEGVVTGYQMTTDNDTDTAQDAREDAAKRARTDEGGDQTH